MTTRFEPAGATLPTINITLKNWFRKPMSPGMTMTPGIGGTNRSWPSRSGTFNVNPTTREVRDLCLQLQRVGNDRLQARQRRRL